MSTEPIEITPQELYQKFISGEAPKLVDVRNTKAYGDWHIFTSQNVPYSQVMAMNDKSEFPVQEPVITVCGRGNDSKVIANKLKDLGIPALSLKGGIREWNQVMNIVQIPTKSSTEVYQFQRIAKGCLSYVVIDKDEAVIIDPVHNIKPYQDFLDEKNVTLTNIFETHLHADHVAGGSFLANKFDAKLFLPKNDPFQFDFNQVSNNDSFSLGNTTITALYTPGHTKGSTSYRINDEVLLVGDTIFADGIGRPDLADKANEFAKYLFSTLNQVLPSQNKDLIIGPAHHGTIGLDHLKYPITLKNSELAKYDQLSYSEDKFVDYAVKSANTTKKPDSYSTIAQINAGILDLSLFDIQDLETGPNRCAISSKMN